LPEHLAWFEAFDRKFVDFTDYALHFLGHSRASCRTYRASFQNFRRYLVECAQHDRAEPAARMYTIDQWVQWNRRRGLSAISTSTFWRGLRPFFKYLVRQEGIQNPFDGTSMPPIPSLVPKARKASECRHILNSARNYPWKTVFHRLRAVALFGVLIYAGLRRGEVTKLEFADVNLEEGTILVRRGKGRFGGKDRVAYINQDLALILRDYIRERQRLGYICPAFFVSTQTKQGLSEAQFIRIVKLVRAASGIPFSIHSLRHSFVTMLLQSGVPLHVAKELAGHTNIQTTEGYLRVWDEEKKEQIRKLRL
jgi:site-specific recombinase XerD